VKDRFNRRINYLRISVTDRCNLRCIYCLPPEGIVYKSPEEILSFEEILKVVEVAVKLGIEKIRITGGEPLVRRDLPELIKKLNRIEGLREVALTSNGILLPELAEELKKAGLNRINISLDTLNPEKFREVTRGGELSRVLEGIELCLSLGFSAVKLNLVLLNGFNTDEILDFVELTRERALEVRFIEYMPTSLPRVEALFFSTRLSREIIKNYFKLIPLDNPHFGTARVFRIEGFQGRIGFISPVSEPFCNYCNKLRLSADGVLRNCLQSSQGIDLKKALRKLAFQEEEVENLIKESVFLKPRSHNLSQLPLGEGKNFSMCQIGG
jgi:cyclic pyranopterin phosphate synthase